MGIGEEPLQVSRLVRWRSRAILPCLFITVLQLPAFAQDTELHSCLPDTNACSETDAIPIPDFCGNTFYLYHGRLSWPALRAVGPITISVQTYRHWDTVFPLYVEFLPFVTSPDCKTTDSGILLLETRGRGQCGGLWQSVGPIDLEFLFGITPGSLYRIRVVFVQGLPEWVDTSPALRCIHVTAEPSVIAEHSWGHVKALYK